MADTKALVNDAINDSIAYARAGERLLALAAQLGHAVDAISNVIDIEEAVAPEMKVAIENIAEAGEAVKRALTFIDARHRAKWGTP